MSDEHVIRPASRWAGVNAGELWEYRELLYFLAWRDIKVRYKQTVLGFLWAILQPVLMAAIFYACFRRVAADANSAYPYALFVLCGFAPWQLFAYALTQSSNSLVANERLLTKVYFPRLLIPLSTVVAGLADFAISLGVLAAALLIFRVPPAWTVIYLPFFVALAVLAALAVGLWLSVLNLQYRDVRYTLTFLTQFWLLATPVAYPIKVIPPAWRPLLALNPMTGVVDGFRWALVGGPAPDGGLLLASVAVVVGLLVGGVFYFRRLETRFADVV